MTERERWWVVGFLEGEGSFGCWKRDGDNVRLTVQAGNTDREPLERLVCYCGGGIRPPWQPKKGKPILLWHLHARAAAALMRELRPFMCPRRQVQIDDALVRWAAHQARDLRHHPRRLRAVS